MSDKKAFVVTIDGPAGVGKTTLARRIASSISGSYLDTGAMFRSVALYLGSTVDLSDGPALKSRLSEISFDLQGCGDSTTLLLNGNIVGNEIRTEKVALLASNIATNQFVRDFLLEQQRLLAKERTITAEGRDMGTVVFPDARCKFFLEASPAVRAERRALQLEKMGAVADREKLAEQIAQRDYQDRTRKLSPLIPASDAMLIDTDSLDIDDVFNRMIAMINSSRE